MKQEAAGTFFLEAPIAEKIFYLYRCIESFKADLLQWVSLHFDQVIPGRGPTSQQTLEKTPPLINAGAQRWAMNAADAAQKHHGAKYLPTLQVW